MTTRLTGPARTDRTHGLFATADAAQVRAHDEERRAVLREDVADAVDVDREGILALGSLPCQFSGLCPGGDGVYVLRFHQRLPPSVDETG